MPSFSVTTLLLFFLFSARAEPSETTVADSVNAVVSTSSITAQKARTTDEALALLDLAAQHDDQQQNSSKNNEPVLPNEHTLCDYHDQSDAVVLDYIREMQNLDPDGPSNIQHKLNLTSGIPLCEQLKDAGSVDKGCVHETVKKLCPYACCETTGCCQDTSAVTPAPVTPAPVSTPAAESTAAAPPPGIPAADKVAEDPPATLDDAFVPTDKSTDDTDIELVQQSAKWGRRRRRRWHAHWPHRWHVHVPRCGKCCCRSLWNCLCSGVSPGQFAACCGGEEQISDLQNATSTGLELPDASSLHNDLKDLLSTQEARTESLLQDSDTGAAIAEAEAGWSCG